MLLKHEKSQLRATIFRHLDGIATAPTAYALHKVGVLDYLLAHKEVELGTISKEFNANEGYLNVALRVLCSQGWLEQCLDNKANTVTYKINLKSAKAFELVPNYKSVVELLPYAVKFPEERIGADAFYALERVFNEFKMNFSDSELKTDTLEYQINKHIEGVILAPIIVLLGVNGLFHKYFMEASFSAEEYHKDPESFKKILDFLTYLGWFVKKNDHYQFTEMGLFFAKRAAAYGVTVSYLPTFNALDNLLFGNPLALRDTKAHEPEKHVHREMNVWGSGGAHATYFKVIDTVVIDLFNKPIEQQPKGILDMGCGNGAFIEHIFSVIEQRTLRGTLLEEYPLFLVGADYNEAALKVTRANLINADIWAKVIWGDIGKPKLLAQDLRENYNIELSDLLNVRTFLDHNRIWEEPINKPSRLSLSSGAFTHRGERLNNNTVEASLFEHFLRWKPYVAKFGLLVIELHTVPPQLTAANLGKTAATAYDATHGYSDQYIVEVEVFHAMAEAAGLRVDLKHFEKFSDSELATVSVNLLRE